MTSSAPLLRINAPTDQPNLSPAQRSFNGLVKQVETSRDTLAQWQSFMLTYEQKVASDYAPLVRDFQSRQADMVRALDAALNRKGLNKSEQRVVQNVICNVAEQLIIETADESIKEIYNKHSDIDFDAEEAAAVNGMKEAVEAMFDMEFGDAAEFNSPEDIMAQLHEKMEREYQQRMDEQAQHGEKRKAKKQTAKQRAREEKLKAEADETHLSMREVYRKLVSALHPDREPDAAERTRKTALMQRVNQAYEKKDLLHLLELQLAIEQIDARVIANLSENRLKHFNKILLEQLAELQHEIMQVQMPLRHQFGLQPYQPLSLKTAMPRLMKDITELKNHIRQIEKEIKVPTDMVAFKIWIKAYRRELRN